MTDQDNTAQTNTDADENGTANDAGTGEENNQQVDNQNQDSQNAADGDNSNANQDGDKGNADDKSDGKSDGKDGDNEEGFHGAPESYEDFTLPEGVEVTEEQLGQFHNVLKELDLNQEGAQKLIDFEMQRQSLQLEGIIDAHKQQQEDWIKEIKQDKDLGGANFNKTMATSNAAVNKFGDDEFKALLKPYDPETNPTGLGLGNNPAFNRVFNRIGKAIAEDSPGDESGEGTETSTAQQRLEKRFPNTKS